MTHGVKRDRFPVSALMDFAVDIGEAVDLCQQEDAPLRPGEHCASKFCDARGFCKAYQRQAFDLMDVDLDEGGDLVFETQDLEDLDLLGRLYLQLKLVEDWCKQVKLHATRVAESGVHIPGTKLVEGKSNRFWADERGAIRHLEGLGFDPEEFMTAPALLSPAKVEALLKKGPFKQEMSAFVEKLEGKPTLVSENNSKPAIAPAVHQTGDHLDNLL